MAKLNLGSKRTNADTATTPTGSSRATTANAMEQRVLAFAEQLGRTAGTFQAKAEGWLDRKVLQEQIASIRDGAAQLLEQLGGGAPKVAKKTVAAKAAGRNRGRSGGVVDARGKTHRKAMPADPDAPIAASQAAKMRMARTMVKTNRRRGRG